MLRAILPLLFFLFFALAATPAFAQKAPDPGIKKLPLVNTQKYDPDNEQARGFKEFTSTLGLATFGNIYAATALDVEKLLLQKLSMPELQKYFPSQKEKADLAASIAASVNEKYLSHGMTNDHVIDATRFAAEALVSQVIDRAMKKEGVKDAGRRKVWSQKILAPFTGCMQDARTYGEGNKCLAALQADAVKNIGLAVGFEMIRQETGPEYNTNTAQVYTSCLQTKKDGADDRVKSCVVKLMRGAIGDYAIDKVRVAAAEETPESADAIAKGVKPAFVKCLSKVSAREGFSDCANSLIIAAGGEIALASVASNKQVQTYFPSPAARQDLSLASKKAFLACMDKVKKAHTGPATLRTDTCAQEVRLGAALAVTHNLINDNVNKVEGLSAPQKKQITDNIGNGLDRCWDSTSTDDKNNACMKSSIEALVGAVAEVKLGNEIPALLAVEKPNLKTELASSVRACIRRELPDNVMQSTDAATKVSGCAAELLRAAALKIADFELRQVVHGKTADKNAGDRLVKQLVDGDLATCLGARPAEADLAHCTTRLKRNAASEVGKLLFQEEFDRFLTNNGGAAAYGITADDRAKFLGDLLTSHNTCLGEKVKESSPASAGTMVDSCFKGSVRALATYLGKLAFVKSSKPHVSDAAKLAEMSQHFQTALGACLDEKISDQFKINDYVANIDSCSKRLTATFTQEIGAFQIGDALEKNLSGPAFATRRAEIQKTLVAQFAGCVDSADSSDKREACITALKRDATGVIAVEAARAQVKTLLNGGPMPKEIAAAEQKLAACLNDGTDPEACAAAHALNMARILGPLKLRTTLGSALGDAKYKDSEPFVASLEKKFLACVNSIPGQKVDPTLMAAIKACGTDMEAQGVAFVQDTLSQWLTRPEVSTQESDLRREVAMAIPCISAVIPSGPVNEEALQHLDPEGLLQAVSKVVGNYINYDAANADRDFDEILSGVMSDLKSAGPMAARQKLFDTLIKGGMVDQLLKSMIRAEVEKSLDNLPAQDRVSPELRAVLVDPATLNAALTPEVMARFRPFMAEKLLKPLLLQGRNLKQPEQKAAVAELQKQVTEALLASPAFGDRLVAGTLQKQIDDKTSWTISKFFARNLLGYSYDWSKIRNTDGAKAAETYVRDQIIHPMVTHEAVAPEEMARRRAEAARLVTEAVKNQ